MIPENSENSKLPVILTINSKAKALCYTLQQRGSGCCWCQWKQVDRHKKCWRSMENRIVDQSARKDKTTNKCDVSVMREVKAPLIKCAELLLLCIPTLFISIQSDGCCFQSASKGRWRRPWSLQFKVGDCFHMHAKWRRGEWKSSSVSHAERGLSQIALI